MPRYFFDIFDGDEVLKDGRGTELADLAAAQREATKALADMARDYLPNDGPNREMAIDVSDKDRVHLFSVSISFRMEPPAKGISRGNIS